MKPFTKYLFLTFSLFAITDLVAQEWQQIASLPSTFRSHHSFGFALEDTGYLVSGSAMTPDGEEATNAFYAYDPDTDSWTQKDDFPGPVRSFGIGDVYEGKAYFGFGTSGGTYYNDLWIYDPNTDEWTELNSCPCEGRAHPAFVIYDNKIYMGMGNNPQNRNDWWEYDIANDSWQQQPDFPSEPRHHPFQFSDGSYVYAGFGHGSGFISNEWYRYDTDNDLWSQVSSLPAEGRVAGQQFSYNGLGYILSGDGDDHGVMETGEFWQYNPSADEWNQLPPHPGVSRWAPASFVLRGEAYILNGFRSSLGFLAENYKIDLDQFDEARLSISLVPTMGSADATLTDEYCDAVLKRTIEVTTPYAFESDVVINIVSNDSGSAVEGEDFILPSSTKTLTAGETSIEFEIILFDNAVIDGDKLVSLDLVADETISDGNLSFEIEENDRSFDTNAAMYINQVGNSSEINFTTFGGNFTDVVSQFYYAKEELDAADLRKSEISSISLDVNVISLSSFQNCTIKMANYSGGLDDGFVDPANIVEVYNGTLFLSEGWSEIPLDQIFEYNGVDGIWIEICHSNFLPSDGSYLEASNVNYTANVHGEAQNADTCPKQAISLSDSKLPNIRFHNSRTRAIYNTLDVPFRSTITEDETIYFQANDSIFLSVDITSGDANACFESSLVSNTHDIIIEGTDRILDRVVYSTSTISDDSSLELNLVVPVVDDFDYDLEALLGLYSTDYIGDDTDWQSTAALKVTSNDDYAIIKVPYQGEGYYAIASMISNNIIDITADLEYDQVLYYDILGRSVSKTQLSSIDRPEIIIKAYIHKGQIVHSEKILLGIE